MIDLRKGLHSLLEDMEIGTDYENKYLHKNVNHSRKRDYVANKHDIFILFLTLDMILLENYSVII